MSASKSAKAGRSHAGSPNAGHTGDAFVKAAQTAGLTPQAGKQALESRHRDAVELAPGASFCASVDLDTHYRSIEPNAPRWDYAVGVRAGSTLAYWVEPHPASSTGSVREMIQKLDWLRGKLNRPEFSGLREMSEAARNASDETPFRWIATAGAIAIRKGSREANLIAAKGLAFPVRRVRFPN